MFVLIKNINGIPTYQDQVTGQIVEGVPQVYVKPGDQLSIPITSYANDAAAAVGGVPIGGLYSTAGAVHVRVS